MNLMHLRYFCKLAETENYTIASSELFISQPGLSGAIASLEQELGLKLFEKKGRNIRLTKYGKEFYEYVKRSMEVLDNGVAVMHEYGGKLSGHIDIGAITTIQSSFLPKVILEFRSMYENIHFQIYQGQSEGILKGLMKGNYDIGFCTFNEEVDELKGIPILTQEVVALVPKTHPLALKESVTLEDLAGSRILTYSLTQQIGLQFKRLLEQKFRNSSDTRIIYEYPNELYLAGVLMEHQEDVRALGGDRCQDAVGLIANAPYMDTFTGLKTIPVEDVPMDFRTVYMIYNEKSFHTHSVDVFIRFIESEYALTYKDGNK